MTNVRIIADDLTGALDSAGQFARSQGAVPVCFGQDPGISAPPTCAFDLETREIVEEAARNRAERFVTFLASGEVRFRKIDSLLRGNIAGEIAATIQADHFRIIIIASAFPRQSRITCSGRQWARERPGEPWRMLPVDLVHELARRGCQVMPSLATGRFGRAGIYICDCASDSDLDAIVDRANDSAGPVLWCGSAGLAGALARRLADGSASCPSMVPCIDLAVVATDAPATLHQMAVATARSDAVVRFDPGDAAQTMAAEAATGFRLRAGFPVILHLCPLPGYPRRVARAAIAAALARLLPALPRPATLFACGGATLYDICLTLNATRLQTLGEYEPGVPVSCFADGLWKGALIVSKSGGFGAHSLLADLIKAPAGGSGG